MQGTWRSAGTLLVTLIGTIGCQVPSVPDSPATGERSADGPFVRVVGSVQDGGFPHAACQGRSCRAARSSQDERYVASLALVLPNSEKVYLIDATPDIREQLDLLADVRGNLPDGVDRAPLDGVFLTHAHMGHYLGLAFLGYEAVHTEQVPVFATPSMSRFLRDNGPWSQLVEKENIAVHEVSPGEAIHLGDGVSVEMVNSPHRDEFTDTVGYLVRGPERRVLFVPDTDSWDRWTPSIEAWLELADVALLDGTFYSRHELPNRSIDEIGHPLVAGSAKRFTDTVTEGQSTRILFTHMNHSNPLLAPQSRELAKLRALGFDIAEEGMEFGL